MSLSLDAAFRNATTGLNAAQAGLSVTSQNVANANTPGYTRKTVVQESATIGGYGMGVRVTGVEREVDNYLRAELRRASSDEARDSTRASILDQVQSMFGKVGGSNSIAADLDAFLTQLESVANATESGSERYNLVSSAKALTDRLNTNAAQVGQVRADTDSKIGDSVEAANAALRQIYDLNLRIQRANALGESASELEDKRDIAIASLSAEIDVEIVSGSNGRIAIYTGAGQTLLDESLRQLTYTPVMEPGADAVYGPIKAVAVDPDTLEQLNDGDVLATGGTSDQVTSTIKGGNLAGLLQVRDKDLAALSGQLDTLADNLVERMNAIHNQGTGWPAPSSLTGSTDVAATTPLSATGNFRIAAVAADGTLVAPPLDIDLSTVTSIGDLRDTINASALGPYVSASIVDGKFTLTATGTASGIALSESTSQVTDTDGTVRGLSHHLGLNNLFDGDDASTIEVSKAVVADPGRVATGLLKDTALLAGDVAITSGDNRNAQALAVGVNTAQAMPGVGSLARGNYTLTGYASGIISNIASVSAEASTRASDSAILKEDLSYRDASVTGVNIDEEMSNLIVFQNAYTASARVLTTAKQMFDELLNIVGN
ncbi:flagellar hook-associated protein FlgK [uncultured Tistrella sp.]|uniref:flagellar hook-associated protein FlgK n=1 Tax=Tistrella mobilis TaxID=171437 RepID=UPI000C09B068|nr:flagellar hook-associated protein FlgK [uncultured Tistrella sp.]MAM76337.1 flagellar hook-associated protein FlgK [Tistrella sp.]